MTGSARRLLPRLWLALCLLWAQHAALAHALEHWLDDHDQHEPGVTCELCVAHAPLAAGLPTSAKVLPSVNDRVSVLPYGAAPAVADTRRPAYFSRAPPAATR
jgi:hypothetical protein